MGDDEIVGIFNDGELWLPDIFTSPSKFTTPQTQPQLIPKPIYTPSTLSDLHFQLYGPMFFKGSNDSDFFISGRCNPSIDGGDGIWAVPTPLQSFKPVQPQVIREERDWSLQRQPDKWFLRSRVVENRVDGGNRGYGGTGVYLPDYTTVTTTTITTGPKKRNSVRVTKQVKKAHKRCSLDKVKEDECNFELPPEIKALPQEWTY